MEIKPEIKFGSIAAVALIAWTIVQYLLGFHTDKFHLTFISPWGMLAILAASIYPAIREKQLDVGTNFSLRLGLRTGLIMTLIASSVASGFMFIYNYKINPLWVDNMIEWQISEEKKYSLSRFANDPDASAIILSNTEMHLCVYFLTIILAGMMISLFFSILRMIRNK
jgi:hypothetical protein